MTARAKFSEAPIASSSSTSTPNPNPSNHPDHNDKKFFEGHAKAMWAVAYTPDSIRIGTGAEDNLIRIWDSKTGAMLLELEGRSRAIYALSFLHDGTRLVSGSVDRMLCIWNPHDEKLVGKSWSAHSDTILAAVYSPDDTIIASASYDNLIRIWDANGRRKTLKIADHPDAVQSVSFSPDGTRLVSGYHNFKVRVFDVRTGALYLYGMQEFVAGPWERSEDIRTRWVGCLTRGTDFA
ncbi:hypothetical protein HYDPIDRAFT_94723 [Hydnomerulius pinastri MD-312]|uniref:Unplaced genomic scaffold scaffold_22, whole genome shotgun sequence n=1 Tax=Hydnomerulius pinastri MD-312 TaxID=994086 RepID=A0A0C9W664_9AGAM|nr:hypothetical protein HYDPIDRAFT_94723 [Hydnomerulius pinastri MD-312]